MMTEILEVANTVHQNVEKNGEKLIWPCREEVISPPLQGGVLGALPSWATNNLKYLLPS